MITTDNTEMTTYPMMPLQEVLTQYKEYTDTLEPRIYKKLSVKLYGKGVILDEPADGALLKMKQHQIAKSGQVILSEIWGKKGAIGFVPPEGDGALCTSHFFLFDVNHKRLEPKYLQALFTANYLEEQLNLEAKGTTGYAAVRPRHLLAAKIPLPSLEEQRRIVCRIEELAAKIEEARGLRSKAIEEVDAIIKASAKAVFEPYSDLHITIEELVGRSNLKNGKSIKTTEQSSDICCVRLSAMRGGRINCKDAKPVPMAFQEAEDYLIQPGDVFIVRGNGSKDLVGQAGLVEECPFGTIFPDLFIRVPLDQKQILPSFFVAWWNNPLMRDCIENAAKTTSGIWKINQGHIASFSIPILPIAEQHRVVNYLNNLQSKVDALKHLQTQTAAELDALLPSILDKAFKGEL